MSEHASTKLLNLATGFAAMQEFLEAYWERGDRTSEDLAALLGSLEIDPAQRADWADAVNRVLGSKARPSRKAIQFMSSRPNMPRSPGAFVDHVEIFQSLDFSLRPVSMFSNRSL